MQVTETLSDGLKREYRIVVPAADIQARVDARLDEIGATARIKGFRSGKAPRPVLRRRYGKEARAEAVRGALDSSWRQALLDRGVKPALPPRIDVAADKAGADLEYTLAVEMLPEFEPADVKGMKLTQYTAEVSGKWLEDSLRGLADSERSFEPAEEGHAAREGDALRVSFEGTVDGQAFQGGSGEDALVTIGSGRALPGFEEGLVGARKGDAREIAATIPSLWPATHLAGKAALFTITVQDVLLPSRVAVDDALARRLGMADLDALRAALRERRRRDLRAAARLAIKRQVLDKLAEMHDFPAPAGLVDREFQSIWRQIEQDMAHAGTTWETAGESEEDARRDYREIAERRVRLGLVLTELGGRNGISVSQDELNRAIVAKAREYPGKEREMFEMFRSNPELMNEIRAPLYEAKVIDYIVEMADTVERAVSEAELYGVAVPMEGEGDARSG